MERVAAWKSMNRRLQGCECRTHLLPGLLLHHDTSVSLMQSSRVAVTSSAQYAAKVTMYSQNATARLCPRRWEWHRSPETVLSTRCLLPSTSINSTRPSAAKTEQACSWTKN